MNLTPSPRPRRERGTLRARNLLLFASLLTLIGWAAPYAAGAQEPPRPTQRIVSSFDVSLVPGQYDVINQILDFPPGAATRLHQHGGQAFVTVLEGQVTRREGTVETVFGPGQTFIELPHTLHTVTNKGSVNARVFASFLLVPGARQTIDYPGVPAPAVSPKAAFVRRTTLNTQPGEFTLTQAIVDFAPGAFQPPHRHGGQGLVMMIDGEVAFTNSAGEVRLKPGGIFADIGDPHDALNVASGTSTTAVTFLIRKGERQTTLLTATAGAGPAIQPPATGDGGLLTR
jgi:quercetin dioxygenase-like cupin family protein